MVKETKIHKRPLLSNLEAGALVAGGLICLGVILGVVIKDLRKFGKVDSKEYTQEEFEGVYDPHARVANIRFSESDVNHSVIYLQRRDGRKETFGMLTEDSDGNLQQVPAGMPQPYDRELNKQKGEQ